MPIEQVNKYKGQVIADNFKIHYENNEFYRNMCDKKQITPEDIKGFDDLNKIPLIPIQSFKQRDSHLLLTSKLNEIEYEMRSTGTSGIPSVARRDRFTVDSALESVIATYREFFQISRGMGLFLFPPTEEMPEMGMVKALNIFLPDYLMEVKILLDMLHLIRKKQLSYLINGKENTLDI